jgi:tubulin alpha
LQPDGYLTEERKAEEEDHGFSTFFSETGELQLWEPENREV